MHNMTVRKQLTLAFSVMLALILLISVFSWNLLSSNKHEADVIVNTNNVKIAHAYALRGHLNAAARAIRNYLIYSDPNVKKNMLGRFNEANKNYDVSSEKLQAMIVTERAKQIMSQINTSRDEVRQHFASVISLIEANKTEDAAQTLLDKVQAPQDKWFEEIQGMIDQQEKQNQDAITSMNQKYVLATNSLIISVLVALVAGLTLAALITRRILGQLGGEPAYAVDITEKIAAGNLNVVVDMREGDTSSLLYAMNKMRLSLAKIVQDVRTSADTITHGASEIATGNMDLSSRTEQQAGALEETASSMEQLNSTVRQNADNARQANQLAQSASEVAARGGNVVGQVIETMGAIDTSSKKIVDIISVIDGIAFQTNILALNAAVEAARAGEQGRGFAVVASEVRNLAQRSAAAAKEVKALIDESVANVIIGSKLVNDAGTTIAEVVQSVRHVTDVMSEISASNQEQTSGIDQISHAIMQMDQVTQQNAALVEEAAAASASLEDHANKLLQAMSVFQIENNANHQFKTVSSGVRMAAANDKTSAAKPVLAALANKTKPAERKIANSKSDEWDEF
ncbi:methyl-accepting chemotaxis protein [Undibacterium sp. Dicai25W]|uniref:methyl-accepting chemotaxis protein n=1 Tax=Undibacterium sp. Dicai25W TaxID=3413034 RepID=UPI003BF31329